MAGSLQDALAINGGSKAFTRPWPARHLFGEEEKKAAVALFDKSIASGNPFGYNGEEEEAYCKEFAEFLGGGYADAVNSGTNAVYVALRSLDLEPFTEVICPCVTDPGGVMPVPLMNCIPVPADSAPGSYNIGPDQIEARITERTSAVIVAHIAGLPADMDPIMEIARARNIAVVEDCAQAHGATYKGRHVGTIGDVGAFSTMNGKHHASGGQGGLVFTRDEARYWKIRRAADRGKPFGLTAATNVVASLNMNSNELSAAIGRVQLRKLPAILASRRRHARQIAEGCRTLKTIRMTDALPNSEGAYWFLFFTLDTAQLATDKETFVRALLAEGLKVEPSYLHLFSEAEWFKNKSVFGTSRYPWACPLYKGDPKATYPTPNILGADAAHFRMFFHVGFDDRAASEVLAAFRKVEAAYLKR